MARKPLVLAAVFLVFSLPAAGEPAGKPAAFRLPSAAEARGEGAGKIFVMPVTAGTDARPLDPAGFQVHLAAPGTLALETPALPAGTWIALPGPEAELWLEGSAAISPYTLRVARPAAGSAGGVVQVPVAAAGKASLHVEIDEGVKVELHLWSAGPFRDGAGKLQGGLVRRIPLPLPAGGVAMPAGTAVAGIFEPKAGRYLLLSRPFAIGNGATAAISTEVESVFAQLVADLGLGGAPAEETKLRLDQLGLETEADLAIVSRDRKVAFWYELIPAETSVAAGAGDLLLPPWKKTLASGDIEALRGELAPRPALEVELILPAELTGRQLKLAARSPDRYRTFEEIEFTGDFRHAFRRLPLEPVELLLETPLGDLLRQVDLSAGEDQRLLWEPRLLALEGTVYYDGQPRRASLIFRPEVKVDTDGTGRYRAELLGDVRTLQVRVDGMPGDPHVELLGEPRTASGRLDIHVPPVLFSVRVIDAASRQPIAAARVEVANSFAQPAAAPAGPAGAAAAGPGALRQLRQNVRTGADGKAWVPPVQPGILELKAAAEDYLDGRPLRIEVPDKPERQEFELRLERIESTTPLELVLPGGGPAARASLALFDGDGEAELWRGTSDDAGRIEVPAVAGLLLVTSTESAFLETRWPLESRRLVLPFRAANLLLVRVTDREGRPAEGAEIALFLDGRVYRRDVLGFLIGAPPFSGPGGEFIAYNLPARAFGLLAFSPLSPAPPAEAATEIRHPWPDLVELRLAQ